MTENELKARGLAIQYTIDVDDNGNEIYNAFAEAALVEMAKWKDEQFFKKAHRWIEKIAPLTGYSTYDMIEDFDQAMEE